MKGVLCIYSFIYLRLGCRAEGLPEKAQRLRRRSAGQCGRCMETMKTKKRGRDSNSESRDMNPVCCLCITPQRMRVGRIYPYIGYCAFFCQKLKEPEKIFI